MLFSHDTTLQDAPQAISSHVDGPFLSTVHNSPLGDSTRVTEEPGEVTFWMEGTLIEVKKPAITLSNTKHPVKSLRGAVSGFSRKSRRRLQQRFAMVRRNVLPLFLTLTYPAEYPDPQQAKEQLDTFFKRMERAFARPGVIWKMEPQERGAPHFHLAVWGIPYAVLRPWAKQAWYEVVGSGDEHHEYRGAWIEIPENRHQLIGYISKYMSKQQQQHPEWDWPGRWWGMRFSHNIPWAEAFNLKISRREAIAFMRAMRRYAGLRGRDMPAMSIFCNDPSFWLGRWGAICDAWDP